MMAIGIGRDVDKRFRADAVARRERLGSEDLYFGAASRVPCLLSELLLVIHALDTCTCTCCTCTCTSCMFPCRGQAVTWRHARHSESETRRTETRAPVLLLANSAASRALRSWQHRGDVLMHSPLKILLLVSAIPSSLSAAGNLATTCAVANEGDEIVFDCGGDLISAVDFASYGQPRGTCAGAHFDINQGCHFAQTGSSLEDRCLGQATCLFVVTSAAFGGKPHCADSSSKRWLAAVLTCGETHAAGAGGADAMEGIGIGWQFIIFVVCIFTLYFGAGIAYNMRRNGFKGVDAVPHIEMWKDLPALVRDGVIFSVDTIKSKGRPGYDGL